MKRKRRSESRGDSPAKKSGSGNPFLDLQKASFPSSPSTDENLVLQKVLLFNTSKANDVDAKTVDILLEYVDQEESTAPSTSLISRDDVASMLLQWAVKTLIHASSNLQSDEYDALHWKTLTCTLQWLLSADRSEISTSLTQSTLHKLVPYAAQTALLLKSRDATACYAVLAEKLYCPNMDLACRSLLPLVDTNLPSLQKEGLLILQVPDHVQVLESTVKLLIRLQSKANPKRSFQLLTEPDLLAILSRWRLVESHTLSASIRELLVEGLFSPLHHIEGFRNMNLNVPCNRKDSKKETDVKDQTKREFRCYQESLLETIAALLRTEHDTNRTAAATRLIPELIKGFVEKSNEWERDYGGKAKKKGAAFVAAVQFRLWSNLIWPVVRMLCQMSADSSKERQFKSDSTYYGLVAIRETLSVVMKHDVYLPSYQDKDNVQFIFLETLVTMFLNINAIVRSLQLSDSLHHLESECVQGLDHLLSLNHLVLHERLSLLLAACGRVHRKRDLSNDETHRKSLISTVVNTYQKLRQLDHLFRALFRIVDTDGRANDEDSEHKISLGQAEKNCLLASLNDLISGEVVHNELAVAVQRCPSDQIHDLFCEFNESIGRLVNLEEVDSSIDVSFTVTLFVLLIQNVRVDKHTAVGVYSLCEEAIEKTVRRLMNATGVSGAATIPRGQELKRAALVLCGWLVDLRTRCAFWLDEVDETKIVDTMMAQIIDESGLANIGCTEKSIGREKRVEMLNDSGYGSMVGEVQFLLCHRIRELHFSIYEAQRAELTNHAGEQKSCALEDEARQLVNFVVSIFTYSVPQQKESSLLAVFVHGSRWKMLAETLVYWAPYSEPKHIDSFLSWLFATLSRAEDDPVGSAHGIVRPYPGDDAGAELQAVADEKRVAEALMRDASFFEISEVAARFHAAGVRCLVEILHSVSLNMMDLSDDPSVRLSLDRLGVVMHALASKEATGQVDDPNIKTDVYCHAARLIRILNGAPQMSHPARFDEVMRLDVLACSFCFNSSKATLETLMIPLLCAFRTYTASSIVHRDDFLLDDSDGLAIFLRGHLEMTTALTRCLTCVDYATQREFIESSAVICEAITSFCLSRFTHKTHPLETLLDCFAEMVAAERPNAKMPRSRVLMNMSRSVAKRLVIFLGCREVTGRDDLMIDMVLPFVKAVQEMFGGATVAGKSLPKNKDLYAEWLLFVGEITRLSKMLTDTYHDFVSEAILHRLVESGKDGFLSSAIDYYLASMVASGVVSRTVSDTLFDRCLLSSTGNCNMLADATFCDLVQTMRTMNQTEEVRLLLAALLDKARASTDARRLHALVLFRAILQQMHGKDELAGLSHVARNFFTLSLELLYPCDGLNVAAWEREVNAGISLLIGLTQRKDILAIRERDLALVLARVELTLGQARSFRNPGASFVDGRVYSSCFMLVSSFLQRFPKQLYTCVPSVVSVLHNLQRHALYGEVSDPEVMRRAQMFTRLAELLIPHRDVYKKHVLGLILEFVGAMRSDSEPSRSKTMVPAIYCLLDVLSQYETEQLNTMMDSTAKALFRSIYQSHQKAHTYKGQY